MRRRTDLLREDEAAADAHLAQESDYEANVLVFQHRKSVREVLSSKQGAWRMRGREEERARSARAGARLEERPSWHDVLANFARSSIACLEAVGIARSLVDIVQPSVRVLLLRP